MSSRKVYDVTKGEIENFRHRFSSDSDDEKRLSTTSNEKKIKLRFTDEYPKDRRWTHRSAEDNEKISHTLQKT